jgi:PAS domain S-box-containing protein
MPMKLPSASAVERLPWFVRASLGLCTAVFEVALTYAISPLRAFPLLLAFPTVILSAWFFGMEGGIACAVADVILVDAFLTRAQFRFAIGGGSEWLRMALFLSVSITLGWMVRRFADRRSELRNRDLRQQLVLADAERRLAEERASASEALRQRHDELQLALRAHGMGLWSWDVQRGAIEWTDEVYRLLGHEPGSITPSLNAWFDAIHREDLKHVKESTARDLQSGHEFSTQFRIVRPDGSIRWIESHSTSRRDDQGKALRLIGVLADVTDRKHSEEAMLRAEKLAVAGRLAASVAHEINNPLEAIANLLYLITITSTAAETQAHAQRALEELMRVSLVTQSTLKFHRQAGAPHIARLSEVLDSVLVLFRARMQVAEIHLEVRVSGEAPIACMPGEAQQIFANLISNAIDATPRGGKLRIRLRPSCDWRDQTVRGMRVTFADSGVGMDRATMRRIFEPFFTTKLDTGTGLGLWVVAQLAERHRGEIRVWSSPNPHASGTVFSLFLPLGRVPESSHATAAPVSNTNQELMTG